jgi:CRISPR-associated protein Cas6/Cse3/CasE subtype I-E
MGSDFVILDYADPLDPSLVYLEGRTSGTFLEKPPAAAKGKTTGNRTGLLGDLGVVFPTGATLSETLLFNLLVLNDGLSAPTDLPVWEREPLTAAWTTRPSLGLLDLYTWPARRVRLIPETEDGRTVVRRALVCAGDRFELSVTNLKTREPHTAWYRPKAAKSGTPSDTPAPVYRPSRHDPGQELWRGLGGILGWDRALTNDDGIKPQVLKQLSERFAPGPGLPVLQLRACGVSYGLQSAVITETYADSLPLPVALLMEGSDRGLGEVAVRCVADTEGTAWALGQLAADLVFAEGGNPDAEKARREQVRRQYFADLDPRFRAWIATVTEPGEDMEERYREQWHAIARAAALRQERILIAQAGPSGLRSRTRTDKKDSKDKNGASVKVNSVTARQAFRSRPRVLWRLDTDDWRRPVLWVSSPDRPSFEHITEDFGWPNAEVPYETRSLDPLLGRLSPGQEYVFRLTMNPVRAEAGKVGADGRRGRGKVVPLVGAAAQVEWLVDRAAKWGFEVPPGPVPAPDGGAAHAVEIRDSRRLRFSKGRGRGRDVVIQTVTVEGLLRVTDAGQFARTLTHGVGRGRAYGCGLVGLASPRG